jgi:hypothetical protein
MSHAISRIATLELKKGKKSLTLLFDTLMYAHIIRGIVNLGFFEKQSDNENKK